MTDDWKTGDLAGQAHWAETWSNVRLATALQPHGEDAGLYDQEFHRLFCHAFADMATQGMSLIEVGCGNSGWLPYFAREWGLAVTGIDYSELGVETARAVLAREDIDGDVVRGDMFRPPDGLAGRFDVVVSLGVVEHFSDTVAAMYAVTSFARPGGLVLTEVPNLRGFNGWMMRRLNREVYDRHVAMNAKELARYCEAAGLIECEAHYLLPFNVWMWSTVGLDPRRRSTRLKNRLIGLLARIQGRLWRCRLPVMPFFAPYIVCTGRRPLVPMSQSPR